MKRIAPCLVLAFCFPIVYAGYENGGVITTYVGDVDCYSGLLEVKNGGAADLLEMQNFSHLKVWSTSPLGYMGGIWDINIKHNSHLDYHGGWTDELTIRGYATADLYGGRIDGISSYQYIGWRGGQYYGLPHINIHCQPGYSWKEENGVIRGIEGLWWDGTSCCNGEFQLFDRRNRPSWFLSQWQSPISLNRLWQVALGSFLLTSPFIRRRCFCFFRLTFLFWLSMANIFYYDAFLFFDSIVNRFSIGIIRRIDEWPKRKNDAAIFITINITTKIPAKEVFQSKTSQGTCFTNNFRSLKR